MPLRKVELRRGIDLLLLLFVVCCVILQPLGLKLLKQSFQLLSFFLGKCGKNFVFVFSELLHFLRFMLCHLPADGDKLYQFIFAYRFQRRIPFSDQYMLARISTHFLIPSAPLFRVM